MTTVIHMAIVAMIGFFTGAIFSAYGQDFNLSLDYHLLVLMGFVFAGILEIAYGGLVLISSVMRSINGRDWSSHRSVSDQVWESAWPNAPYQDEIAKVGLAIKPSDDSSLGTTRKSVDCAAFNTAPDLPGNLD